jgi:hypothetical protein
MGPQLDVGVDGCLKVPIFEWKNHFFQEVGLGSDAAQNHQPLTAVAVVAGFHCAGLKKTR